MPHSGKWFRGDFPAFFHEFLMNLRSNTHHVTSATRNVPRSSLYKTKKECRVLCLRHNSFHCRSKSPANSTFKFIVFYRRTEIVAFLVYSQTFCCLMIKWDLRLGRSYWVMLVPPSLLQYWSHGTLNQQLHHEKFKTLFESHIVVFSLNYSVTVFLFS